MVSSITTVSYQWHRDGLAIPGATGPTLDLQDLVSSATYSFVVTNQGGSVTSDPIPVAVLPNTPPKLLPGPISTTAKAGSEVYLTVRIDSSGNAATFVQWYRNGVLIPGANSTLLLFSSVTSADAGTYWAVVGNWGGTTTSSRAEIIVTPADGSPFILRQAKPVIALPAGGGFGTSVIVIGDGPISYQWRKDGAILPSQTQTGLGINGLTPADAGEYILTASNAAGAVTARPVRIEVYPPSEQRSVRVLPETVYMGTQTPTIMTAIPTGTGPFTYQWYKNYEPIPGATSQTLAAVPGNFSMGDQWFVLMTGAHGSATSGTTPANAGDAPSVPPSITQQPTAPSGPLPAGSTLTLTVGVTGSWPYSIAWYRNGSLIPGMLPTLTLENMQPGDSGDYKAVIHNSLGQVESNLIPVTVAPSTLAPTITGHPVSRTSAAGSSANFTVSASGTPPPSYQWYRRGVGPIAGATTQTLTLTNLQPSHAGAYYAVASNTAGEATSDDATLTVSAVNTSLPPTIVQQPASQNVTRNGSVVFSVIAMGTPPPTYQWYSSSGGAISGATSATLTISGATDSNTYYVRVTNSAGTLESAQAQLTVLAPADEFIVTSQPASLTVAAGAGAAFSVSVNRAGANTYQWYRNGELINGANTATLTLDRVTVRDAGRYQVVVNNRLTVAPLSATSEEAVLTVTAAERAGVYFGQVGGGSGGERFGFFVRPDGTAVLLGQAMSQNTGLLATDIRLNPDGTFTTTVPVMSAAVGRQAAGRASLSAVAESLQISGSVANGVLTASITGTSLTLTASRSPSQGVTGALAGLYEAPALNSAQGLAYTLIDATGQAFVLVQSGGSVDSGAGTVDGAGRVTAQTASGNTYAGTVDGASGTVEGEIAAAGGSINFAGLAEDAPRTDRLVNISTRSRVVADGAPMIAGFVITGTQPKPVLIRAAGPALATLGVADPLANPRLQIVKDGAFILDNDDWGSGEDSAAIAAAAARLGGFPLGNGSRDAAILASLEPGVYTAHVTNAGGADGLALVEVYDAIEGDHTAFTPKLVNISTRSLSGDGDNVLIAGFVITGNAPKQVLLRGIGPGLAAQGVSGVLSDPTLGLYKAGVAVRENDNWDSAPEIAAAAARVGAFPLTSGSKDAALLIHLEPGLYTALLRPANGTAGGTGMVEVYEVQP